MRQLLKATLVAAAFAACASGASAQSTLRIGLAEDPDVLDPTLARTYVGRIVFSAICDKLFDIDDKLNLVPQLATAHETSADGKTVFFKSSELAHEVLLTNKARMSITGWLKVN